MKYYVPTAETKEKIDLFRKGKEDAITIVHDFISEELGIESNQFHIGSLSFIPDEGQNLQLPKFMKIDKYGCWRPKENYKKGKELKEKFEKLNTRGFSSFDFLHQFLTTKDRSSGRFSWEFDIVNGEYSLVKFEGIDVEGLVKEGRFIEKEI